MKDYLFNPMVDVMKKRELLSSLANDAGLSKHTTNFLNLLLDSTGWWLWSRSLTSSRPPTAA